MKRRFHLSAWDSLNEPKYSQSKIFQIIKTNYLCSVAFPLVIFHCPFLTRAQFYNQSSISSFICRFFIQPASPFISFLPQIFSKHLPPLISSTMCVYFPSKGPCLFRLYLFTLMVKHYFMYLRREPDSLSSISHI